MPEQKTRIKMSTDTLRPPLMMILMIMVLTATSRIVVTTILDVAVSTSITTIIMT